MNELGALKQRVWDRIRESDLVDLSRELVRRPSVTGQEKEVSDYIVSVMNDIGMAGKGVEGEPGRPNAVGTLKGETGTPKVMLSGHLDTVPIGDPKKWITDPYGGEVIDGKIYGRGSMDSKGGGIASSIIALKAIIDEGIRLKGDVHIVGTVDEEVLGPAGAKYLAKSRVIDPDLCLYCVHSDMEVKAYFKGILWVKLTSKGQTAHGSMPQRGINAITRAARFLMELEKNGLPYERHPVLGDMTISYGWIQAGPEQKYNLVADLCEMGIDIRMLPGQSSESLVKALTAIADGLKEQDPSMDIVLERFDGDEAFEMAEDNPTLDIIKRVAAEVMQKEPSVGGTIAAGDLGPWFALGKKGVGFGPGDLERGNAHKENEFLEIDQLVAASRIYATFILETAGVAS
jgi:acetylornithine deacetylase/succinyl-diaminopimelate desuccinylase family protein